MDLSVIIVNFNQRDFLTNCLDSLARENESYKDLMLEVFVVDNASADDSVDYVESRYPWVTLIKNQENRGFSRANNQALPLSQGRFVLLLNNDTEVRPGALKRMVEFADSQPKAGAVGCTLLDSHGKRHRLPMSIFDPRLYMRHRPHRVDWIVGAAVLLRREALTQLGGLDEDYFFYYEDADLGVRLKKADWHSYLVPEAEIVHHEKKSTSGAKPLARYHLHRGRLLLAYKHYGPLVYHLTRLKTWWDFKRQKVQEPELWQLLETEWIQQL